MSYSITIIRQDRTDLRPKTFKATKLKLVLLLLLFIGLPVLGFWVSYSIIAPSKLEMDISALKERAKQAESSAEEVGAQFDAITEENQTLRTELNTERQQRAELEAKMTIVENARQESGEKSLEMEEELLTLQQRVKFYEQFMKPANEQAPMQCFNMSVKLQKGKVKYGINFMKNDQKNKEKVKMSVAFRLLAGTNVEALNPATAETEAPLHERSASLSKDVRLTGSFGVDEKSLPEGLRLLDVKAYDDDNKVLAHCWKAF
ncbi:MAG: hypothetical protein OXR68_00990 [Alphaproteobacteria bacterium]|nr:hypothetical protein [Alphaproteobacteria bacterium]MDD9919186.1 hypothetical protein [Alphaproteobacteria bacterium]